MSLWISAFFAAYIVAAPLSWYFLYKEKILQEKGISSYIGGSVLEHFWRELPWYLPGGFDRRVGYALDIFFSLPDNVSGHMVGKSGKYWHYQYVAALTLGYRREFEEFVRDAFPSPWVFWGVKVGIFFFLGPVAMVFVAAVFLFCSASLAWQGKMRRKAAEAS